MKNALYCVRENILCIDFIYLFEKEQAQEQELQYLKVLGILLK